MTKNTIKHRIVRLGGWALTIVFAAATLWGPPASTPTGPSAPPVAALGMDPVAPGGLESVLARAQRGLRWASRRVSFAVPLGAAVCVLLRGVAHVRRSAA